MSQFDHQRLTQATLHLDIEGLRSGAYSDQYFENMRRMLTHLASEGYTFAGTSPRLESTLTDGFAVSEALVEMQIFMRRNPFAIVGGIDCALEILRYCTGEYTPDGTFISTTHTLEVEALEDGAKVPYTGDPMHVVPVLKIRGKYRHFAALETPILGYLTRISRIATNVYLTLVAAQGKPVLFFPARFDLPGVQAADGYAYFLGIQRYNADFGQNVRPFISTDAQGAWWGGKGSGTVPHAVIANFLADTAEAMVQYARTQPLSAPRIALVDFENNCVNTSLRVAERMFAEYCHYLDLGDTETAQRFQLTGVRLDTGGTQIDASLTPTGEAWLDYGVNPRLVRAVREALDNAWQLAGVAWQDEARRYYQQIKIIATGGFTAEKIARFEVEGVPVDTYGVGSSLLMNDKTTNTDFTADVVRVCIENEWYDMAKVGRQSNDNPDLEPVDLALPR